jgi:peptide/nickel transport system substrate-binding protein
MNWKLLDSIRKNSSPLEVDLIEHYTEGAISRRDFLKRGAILGLGLTTMAGVIAACGGDAGTTTTAGDAGTTTTAGGAGTVAGTQAPGETAAPTMGGEISIGIQQGDANSGLDPLNMLDLGTYSVVSSSFEYLVGLAPDGNIGNNGLATDWSPNADGSAWTFNLRPDVMWHDGTPFTSADVAATVDRMVVAGAGVAGVLSEGAVETPDDLTAVFNLDKPNGNLPVLISIYNPQSLITPADYSDGTTLDARPGGTGPWIFESHDPTTFTTVYTANDNYWDGRPNLDKVTLIGFGSEGAKVSAMQAREINMIQSFGVIDGTSLLNDDNFKVLTPPSANHRQLWFNTQLPEGGPFTDARVRRAIAYTLDRQQMVDTLLEGFGSIANDHPVHHTLPFFDADATPQRTRDIDMAKQLLVDAGQEGLTATIQAGDIQMSPDMAAIVEQNAAEAGITLSVGVTANSDFYGEYWCTGASYGASPETSGPGRPCGASAAIGIVDYGHRPTPDVYFGRALETDGDWNSSNYASADFDALFAQYQAAVDVDGQKNAVGEIQKLLHEDAPALYPFWFDYLSGHDTSVSGVQVTALGHIQLQKASIAS